MDAEAGRDLAVESAKVAMRALTDEQRSEVMSEFCGDCYRRLAEDEQCHCWNDE